MAAPVKLVTVSATSRSNVGVAVFLITMLGGKMAIWLSERINTKNFSGFEQVPGGGVNRGEENLHAAQRELLEETGLEIHSARFNPLGSPTTGQYPNGSLYLTHWFAVKLDSREYPEHMEKDKSTPWRLVMMHDLPALKLMPHTVEMADIVRYRYAP